MVLPFPFSLTSSISPPPSSSTFHHPPFSLFTLLVCYSRRFILSAHLPASSPSPSRAFSAWVSAATKILSASSHHQTRSSSHPVRPSPASFHSLPKPPLHHLSAIHYWEIVPADVAFALRISESRSHPPLKIDPWVFPTLSELAPSLNSSSVIPFRLNNTCRACPAPGTRPS